MSTLVARWESRSGKWWAELYRDSLGYSYRAVGAGGVLGGASEAEAVAEMEKRLPLFQPDAAKTPMRRVL